MIWLALASTMALGAPPAVGDPSTGGAEAAGESPTDFTIGVSETKRYAVHLDRAPPSRTQLKFSRLYAETSLGQPGDELTIEWDPLVYNPAVRTITLPPGTWKVSGWSEPRMLGGDKDKRDISWRFVPWRKAWESVGSAGDDTEYKLYLANGEASLEEFYDGKDPTEKYKAEGQRFVVQVRFVPHDLPSLTDAVKALGSTRSEGVPVVGQRSALFSKLAAEELLGATAEVVVERARSEGFEVLREQLQRKVCNIRWTVGNGSEATGEQMFPETCQVLKSLRLDQLATVGKTLLQATLRDSVQVALVVTEEEVIKALSGSQSARTGCESMEKKKTTALVCELRGEIREIADMGMRAANGDAAAWEPGHALVGVAQAVQRTHVDDENLTEIACVTNLVFAVASQCHALGGCDSRAISDVLDDPSQMFKLEEGGVCATLFSDESPRQWREFWPEMSSDVARIVQVLQPSADESFLHQVQAVAAVSSSIVEATLCYDLMEVNPSVAGQVCSQGRSGYGVKEGRISKGFKAVGDSDAGKLILALAVVRGSESLMDAVVDREPQGVAAALFEMLTTVLVDENEEFAGGRARNTLKKFTHTLGGFAVFATEIADVRGDETLSSEQRRKAEKEAIHALVKAHSNRSGRKGDWVVGLQGSLRFGAFCSQKELPVRNRCSPGAGTDEPSVLQLSLPLGIGIDRIPRKSYRPGPHLAFHPIDVGQFVDLTQPDPKADGSTPVVTFTLEEVFRPSISAGMTFFRPSLPLSVNAVAGLAGLSDGAPGATPFYGMTLGFEVPLFDFH